jgi:hypothetical protein
MRALKYRLTDGTIVNTLAEAKASGKEYTAVMENVREADSAVSPKRQAMLDKYGFVSVMFKDKV